MPNDLHGSLDKIASYKMKGMISLSSREATYVWERMIFRIVQSLHYGSPRNIDECNHLLAAGLMAYNLIDSKHMNDTRRVVINRIINYIDDTFDSIDFPGFSAGRYTDDRVAYFRQFSRMVVNALTK